MSTSTFVPGLGFFSAEDLEEPIAGEAIPAEEAEYLEADSEEKAAMAANTEQELTIDSASKEISDMESDTDSLQQVAEVVKKSEDSGEPISEDMAKVVEISVERYRERLYISSSSVGTMPKATFENFGSDRYRSKRNTTLTYESITETLKAGGRAIANFFINLYNMVVNFIGSLFNSEKILSKKIALLEKEVEKTPEVKSASGATVEGNFVNEINSAEQTTWEKFKDWWKDFKFFSSSAEEASTVAENNTKNKTDDKSLWQKFKDWVSAKIQSIKERFKTKETPAGLVSQTPIAGDGTLVIPVTKDKEGNETLGKAKILKNSKPVSRAKKRALAALNKKQQKEALASVKQVVGDPKEATVWEKIKKGLGKIKDFFVGMFRLENNSIVGLFKSCFNWVAGIASSIKNFFMRKASAVIDWVKASLGIGKKEEGKTAENEDGKEPTEAKTAAA